jgi:outer membrane biosynthesis protein TonB
VNDNVNLADVFQAMEKNSGSLPDTKDNDAIKKYFEKVYGDIDFERVYNSDLKKMIKWFEVLKKNNVEIKLSEPEPEEEEAEEKPERIEPEDKKEPSEKKATKKSAKTSSAKPKETPEKKSTSSKTEKPAKKAAKKKGK